MMTGRRQTQQAALPRGTVAGSSEQQPGEDGDDDGQMKDTAANRPLELVSEPRDADALREQGAGETAGREAEGEDKRVVRPSESAAALDEDATAAEAVVSVNLDEALAERDESRAQRYVATVRPAMAALRYVRPVTGDDQRRPKTEEGGSLQTSDGRSKTEEGGDGAGGVPETEEGGIPTIGGETATADGFASGIGGDSNEMAEADDSRTVDAHGIARVRRAVKQKKRTAKRLRVEKAERRKRPAMVDAEGVDAAVAAVDGERRVRREQQRSGAREALTHRRDQHEGVRLPADGQAAKVRLIQRRAKADGAATDGSDECGVLAEDGLPTATMDVEGERLPVKLDSGARYSVAGTD
jgi:hypothetical protein